jgi:membrane-bound hydrogenase subunit beta
MTEEETVQAALVKAFPQVEGRVRIPRARRIFVEAPAETVRAVFALAVGELDFSILCTITGLDLGDNLGVIYHLARTSGVTLNLSTSVPKERPVLHTVTDYFPAADAYEREITDLLGFQVEGLPPGKRYPLPDDWPAGQHPLRKDWKPEMLNPGAGGASEVDHG